jgi:hypothetical protein
MNAVVVGCLVFSTFIFNIGVSYGCCGLFSTFTLHLVVSCLVMSWFQLFFLNIGGCEVCHIVCSFGMYIINFLNAKNVRVAKVDGESG